MQIRRNIAEGKNKRSVKKPRMDYRERRSTKGRPKKKRRSKMRFGINIIGALIIGYLSVYFYYSFLAAKEKYYLGTGNEKSLLLQLTDRILDKDLPINKKTNAKVIKKDREVNKRKRSDLEPGVPGKIPMDKNKIRKMNSNILSEKDRKNLDDLLARSLKSRP